MRELEAGAVFAGHRIETVAGRGGMGVVYRATQLALDRAVALKVIAAGLLDDQTVRNRFVRESKVAASIDHPNVIPIYYTGEEQGIAYIAMRYVDGDDLRSLVRREGRLDPERAARIATQIGAGLDAAHRAGLVHRDVKPANVLVAAEDHVYLTDFGLTKHTLSVAGSTRPGHWVGTLDYVAPEQIRGERVDARADVYAFGCLLFFTLTGQVPFRRDGEEARLWAHLSAPPPKPTELVPALPSGFDEVIARALAKDPERRYQSAGDLGRAATAAAAGQKPTQRERLVATGAAAPVEAPTVTAAASPIATTQPQPEAETVGMNRAKPRGRLLLAAALIGAAGVGVIAAVALGLGDDAGPQAPATPTVASPTATPGMRVAREIEVGERPNVVRVAGDTVFVGSFKSPRVALVSTKTERVKDYRPHVGVGVSDAAVGLGAVWFVLSRPNRIVRLDPQTGHPIGAPITTPASPGSIALSEDAVWVSQRHGPGTADDLLKLDPETGQTLALTPVPDGISSLTTSPSAVWIANRRRARVQRVDLDTAAIVDTLTVGSSHSEDAVYGDGGLWLATPRDGTVYKLPHGELPPIPISVGKAPRQLALGKGVVYVTNYNSSDLYAIDAKRSRVRADPLSLSVNPFSLDVADGTVWVGSLPENRLSRVVTGRDG